MKKFILLVGIFTLFSAGCGQAITDQANQAVTDAKNQAQSEIDKNMEAVNTKVTEVAGMSGKTFTMDEVKAANSEAKCYSTIGSGVYDLTAWINKHPGGSKGILAICGIDGTANFTKQHGGQAQAEAALASLKIGELAK
jgi:cytochrome b involved in lipid metabolism